MNCYSVGQALPTLTCQISQERVRRYAEASGDYNPLHLDPEFAATTEFKKPIAHGMLALALIGETMAQTFGQPWLRGGTLRARFRGPVYVGEEVTVHAQVSRELPEAEHPRIECAVALRNSKGEDVVTGVATVPLPSTERWRPTSR